MRHRWPVFIFVMACVGLSELPGQAEVDPFAFFRPSVITNAKDRERLDKGGTVSRVVPGRKRAVAVFSATAVDASGDRLVAWIHRIEDLKKSAYVQSIGRFSSPPQLADVATLTLEDGDVSDLRQCRPKRCGLKLAASEIEEIRRDQQGSGTDGTAALQNAFRQLVLRRVQAYIASGHAGLPDRDDRNPPVSPQAAFASLLQQFGFLRQQLPHLAAHLERGSQLPAPGVESFLYWSKERYGAKPVISVTEVSIVRGDGRLVPEAVVVGKQVFATHYTDGSLSVTALVRDGSRRYLAYLNESDVDVLDGFWSGLVRRILERRLKSEAPALLEALRHRLESGEPPD